MSYETFLVSFEDHVADYLAASGVVELRTGVFQDPPPFLGINTEITGNPQIGYVRAWILPSGGGSGRASGSLHAGTIQFEMWGEQGFGGRWFANIFGRIRAAMEEHEIAGLHTYPPALPAPLTGDETWHGQHVDVGFHWFDDEEQMPAWVVWRDVNGDPILDAQGEQIMVRAS